MTQKINGAAYPGIWAEKQVAFIKITFSTNIAALAAANLSELGTTTAVSANTVADSTFGVVESAVVQALKTLETSGTVLGVSQYNTASNSVDVMVGFADGWFSDQNGIIATALPVTNAQAVITTAGTAAADAVGVLVSVNAGAVTFSMSFSYLDGGMTVATSANGALELGNGATSGAYPATSPTGNPGYAPVQLITA